MRQSKVWLLILLIGHAERACRSRAPMPESSSAFRR